MAKATRQGTKKAAYEAKVEQAGMLGTDLDDFIQHEGLSIIEGIAGDFIERVHANINAEKGMVTTGAINDITIQSKDGVVNIIGNSHLIFQDRGVNGAMRKLYDSPHSYDNKKPPVQPILDWIITKNIQLKDNEKYYGEPSPFKEVTEEAKQRSLAFAIREKIFQEGFKPREIYSKEIPKLVEDLGEVLADFAVQNIAQQININPRAGGGKRIVIRPK